jgi:hypothetical protein
MLRLRAFLAGIAILGAATLATAAPAGAVGSSTACTGVIKIARMAFRPPTVTPGNSSTVHVVAVNCTNRSQDTSVMWLGQFIGPVPGIPPGCPAIDPVSQGASFAPHGRFTGKLTYLVPSGCRASALRVTARFSEGGAVLAQRSASLIITHP